MPRLKTVVSNKPEPMTKAVTGKVTPVREVDDGTRLKISLLEVEQADFKGYRRNIFKPVFVDELKVVKQKAVAIKVSPPKIVAAPVQQATIQPESSPLARFTFLGYMKKGAVKTIFLAKDKDILLVKEGDKVAGRYEATEISDQALTLTVTDTGDEIVIPLIENRPLAKSK